MVTPRKAFTLVELLVVIAVIGILVGILLPAVNAVRSRARQAQCLNNMRQVSLAMLSYESSHKRLPIGVQLRAKEGNAYTGPILGGSDYCGTTAFALILPQLEENATYQNYDFRVPYRDAVNHRSIATRIESYQCPSDTSRDRLLHSPLNFDLARSNFVLCFGSGKLMFGNPADNSTLADNNGAFRADGSRRLEDLADGKSKTALVSEVIAGKEDTGYELDYRGVWAVEHAGASSYTHMWGPNSSPDPQAEYPVGTPFNYTGDRMLSKDPRGGSVVKLCQDSIVAPCAEGSSDGGDVGFFNNFASARSRHNGGVNCGFGDGHVTFVSDGVDLEVWRAAGTIDNARREADVNFN
jgi:prepilin-type N-terminal cleavage/methylation domain-containing protein/prepilin-type processing-associated H-X9-DG protein